jgi:hypothetical protein
VTSPQIIRAVVPYRPWRQAQIAAHVVGQSRQITPASGGTAGLGTGTRPPHDTRRHPQRDIRHATPQPQATAFNRHRHDNAP